MKQYTIHGKKSDYKQFGSVTHMDSEGNVFPSIEACAKYHHIPLSNMKSSENIRPVKSRLLGKKICTTAIYVSNRTLFNPDQTDLVKKLSRYEALFTDYIFKKVPAMSNQDGTYSLGMKVSAGNYTFVTS
jgi:hypothetical protein